MSHPAGGHESRTRRTAATQRPIRTLTETAPSDSLTGTERSAVSSPYGSGVLRSGDTGVNRASAVRPTVISVGSSQSCPHRHGDSGPKIRENSDVQHDPHRLEPAGVRHPELHTAQQRRLRPRPRSSHPEEVEAHRLDRGHVRCRSPGPGRHDRRRLPRLRRARPPLARAARSSTTGPAATMP